MRPGFFAECSKLYSAFMQQQDTITVPELYKGIAEEVIKKINWTAAVKTIPFDYKVGSIAKNNKVMVALSAGLDSVYLMHKLKDSGYDVTAVHVAGLNKSSAKYEADRSKRIADAAVVKFKKIVFKSPRQCFPDNPFKNQLILSMMLDAGIKRGIYRYAVGSDWTTPLSDAVIGYTITDAAEVYRAYWKGVQHRFPQAELIFINDNEKKYERLQYLYKEHRASLELVSSCIAPERFREHWHKQNEQRYGIELMSGRCGSCYKCSMEYILLVEAGLINKNEKFYEHAWDILATSKTSHRPDLFAAALPLQVRLKNLKEYGS